MRWIAFAAASLLGGCSLIYNPNNLPNVDVDGRPDAPPIDGRALTVDHADPKILFEGQGTSGARSAILVLSGSNFLPSAQVAIAPKMTTPPTTDGGVDGPGDAAPSDAMPDGGGPPAPQLTVHNDRVTTSSDGTLLAVPVDLPVDPLQSTDVVLDVTVTQDGTTVTLPMATTFRGLPELTDPAQLDSGVADLYSNIALTADWTPTQTAALLLHATGGMSFGGIDASAPGQAGGPGGSAGGAANTKGVGPGGGGAGSLSVLGGGGGGGYSSGGSNGGGTGGMGGGTSGDALIAQLSGNVSSGGGGATKVGGGGGGTLALFAGGTITTGAIKSTGAAGASSATVLTGAGGGGSGGTLVLVSNAGFTPSVDPDVSGGAGGVGTNGAASGGAGGAGRVRINAPNGSCGALATTACALGASFAAEAPLVITHANDPIGALAPIGSMVKVNVLDADGASEGENPFMFTTASAALGPTLQRGYNRVCMYPSTVTISVAESVVCIDVAYIPQ